MQQMPLPWIMLPPEAWESKVTDTVHRETEDRAFDRIHQLSKMYTKGVIPTLAPMHRRALELEAEDMRRNPHHIEDDVYNEVARHMRLRKLQVKALLAQASFIIDFALSVGLDEMVLISKRPLLSQWRIPLK